MANTFQIVIAAKDRASSIIGGVNSALSRVPPSLGRISSAMERAGDTSVLDRLQKGAVGLAQPVVDAARSVGVLNNSLGLVFGAGSLAGAGALVAHWGAVGVTTGNAARGIGIAAARLRTLRGAAELAGVGADEMTGSLGALATTLQDAAFGRNNEAAALLNTLGIATRRTASGAVDAEAALGDLADAIAKQSTPQTQARIAQMFGVQALLPMLRKGRAGWTAYLKDIERLGAVSEETQRQSEELGTSINRLKGAASGVATTIESEWSRKFGRAIDGMTEWTAANKGTAASITEVAGALGVVAIAARFHPILGLVTGLAEGAALIYANWGDIGGFFDRKLAEIDAAFRRSEWWQRTKGKAPEHDAYWWSFGLVGKGGMLWDTDKGSAAAATPAAPPAPPSQLVPPAASAPGVMPMPGGAAPAPSAPRPAPAAAPAAPPPASANGRLPLGIRYNNPGNLRLWPGAAVGANGFSMFATPEAGIAAAAKNLMAYQDRHGINTIAGIVNRWAPASDGNNVPAYIASLTKQTGFAANQPLNLHDEKTLAPLLSAIIRHENGQQPYSQQQIEQAVKVQVEIGGNVPEGTTATAQTATGTSVPTRIEYAMPSFARP